MPESNASVESRDRGFLKRWMGWSRPVTSPVAKPLQRLALATCLVAVVAAGVILARPASSPQPPKSPSRRSSYAPPPTAPEHTALIDALRAARRDGDLTQVARLNGTLSQRALLAADRTLRAWVALRPRYNGWLPRVLHEEKRPAGGRPWFPMWNYADVAADCYSHLVVASHQLAPSLLPDLRDLLSAERRLAPPFSAVNLSTGAIFNDGRRLFGGVEYAKDGLLSVVESEGDSAWSDRLEEVVDAVWRERTATRSGAVVLDGAEKNGEMLQVLARLSSRRGDERYLRAGRAIARAYVYDVLPYSDGVPPLRFDFARGRASEGAIQLRDHGNEMIAGLVEWARVERTLRADRDDEFAAALSAAVERMLDRIMELGLRGDGLWRNRIGEDEAPDATLNDNWGYVSAAYYAYGDALASDDPRRARYLGVARSTLRAAARHRDANWEWGGMDGYADTIEGALYLLAFLDEPESADWVDSEVGHLQAYARPDGFVGSTYLDGNFIRTNILYARWKSAGARAVPWSPDLEVGAARDGDAWRIVVTAKQAWHGRVRFDSPRHREVMGFQHDYPRLNSWPEWLVVSASADYVVTQRDGVTARYRGSELREGIELTLSPGEVRTWRLSPAT